MNIETANRLFQYRKKHNLSQEELAEKIGVSRQAVSKWERAEASPDTDNLIILAKIYGVTLDELLQGESEPEVKENPKDKVGVGEPDPDTNYVQTDKVSFKNGIHVNSADGDKVDISFAKGVHVDTKDGEHVHIDGSGIHVQEADKTRVYTTEDGEVMVDEEISKCHKEHHRCSAAHKFPMWLIATAGFFLWGFSGWCMGFALSWVCLLAIPLYHSLVSAIINRKADHFAYPVLCVAVYILAGFLLNGWAIWWLVFLTIPLYYWIAEMSKNLLEHKDKTRE